jgi:hypothetical protein
VTYISSIYTDKKGPPVTLPTPANESEPEPEPIFVASLASPLSHPLSDLPAELLYEISEYL